MYVLSLQALQLHPLAHRQLCDLPLLQDASAKGAELVEERRAVHHGGQLLRLRAGLHPGPHLLRIRQKAHLTGRFSTYFHLFS